MAAMVLVLALDWLRHRRIPALHALSAVLVLVFGSATLLLHNRLFIQWKPTVLFWALGLAFLASSRIGERTLTERLLAPALGERLRASPAQWQRLNLSSGVLYALLGALNLVVAYNASERARVNFKVTLVAGAFRGRSRLERHRMVYAAVAPLMGEAVHALNIVARSPEEASDRG